MMEWLLFRDELKYLFRAIRVQQQNYRITISVFIYDIYKTAE